MFAKRSEQLSPAQGSLLEDLIDTDITAIEADLTPVNPAKPRSSPSGLRCQLQVGDMSNADRLRIRQEQAAPIIDALRPDACEEEGMVPRVVVTAANIAATPLGR